MAGFNQLIKELENQFPNDWWIVSRRESSRLLPDAFPEVQIYEKALSVLDDESWLVLSENARLAFKGPRTSRGKNQLFNLLNEALAYEFLNDNDFDCVRMLKADRKNKKPDISFELNGKVHYCEVKTIGASAEELGRFDSGEVFDSGIYIKLTEQFLLKLCSTIDVAEGQLLAVGGRGLIYIVVHFDDFTLSHYGIYRRQILAVLVSTYPNREIIIRVGINQPRYIRHCT